jgi:spermidine synthase
MLVANLLGRSRGFTGSVERIKSAFDGRALVFPSCDSGNAVAFAATGEPIRAPLAELKTLAQSLKKATSLNLLPTLARLAQWQTCPGGRLEL